MVDETQDNDQLEGDRGIPSVSRDRQGNASFGLAMVIFLIVGALVIGVFWPESEPTEEEADLTAKVEEEFDRTNIPRMEIPDLPRELPPQREPTATEGPATVVATAAPQMSPKELARLKAEQDLRERRKRSPLVVYDVLKDRAELQDAGVAGNSVDVAAERAALLQNIQDATAAVGRQGSTDLDSLGDRLQTTEVPSVRATFLHERQYTIAQGKMINAVLETAISSDLPGMVRAVVSEPVYSEDGRTLLIEQGSRLVGEYRAGLTRGQGRIFVIWNRVLTPWGVDVQIGSPGTDSLGRSGLTGWIDSHFLERFGASILLSVIGAAAAQQNDNQFNVELGQGFNESAEIALENSINIRPTLYKNQGDRISVFVARDVNFRDAVELRQQ